MMDDISGLITAVAALIAAVSGVWGVYLMRVVKHQSNSMKDELVAEVRRNAYRNGEANRSTAAPEPDR